MSEFQPPDIEEYEDEPTCKDCGYQMDWAECYMIDCEDGVYDAYEQDAINNDPGTYMKCYECNGDGGHWYCPNKDCSPAIKESQPPGKEPR